MSASIGEVAPGQHDRGAVVADGARAEHDVALAHPGGREVALRGDEPHPGRRDVHAIGRAPIDHLRVAGHDGHTGRRRRVGHVGHHLAQGVDGEALLEDERHRERQGTGAHHGQVVHCAVHGQVAHGAAGKAQRFDDIGVGAEGQPLPGGQRQHSGVGLRPRVVTCEGGEEHAGEQGRRGLPAGPVGQGHDLLPQAGAAPAKGLDALEDGGLSTGLHRVGHRITLSSSLRCTTAHSCSVKAAWASCVRWTLSDRTTRQCVTASLRAMAEPS